ncbi:MAG: flippase-like domain-containing protein [Anaerolineae bacterium]|nr:flippase-like domain-containing protein [Anaerolineae bacterium]
MKRNKYISITVLIAVTIAIILYLCAQPQLLTSLSNLSWSLMALIIICRFFFLMTNGLYQKAFANKFEVDLKFVEWFGLSIVTTMGNYMTPFSGGMVFRAAYLKHQHKFAYARFATLIASNYLVVFWVVGVVGFGVLISFFPLREVYLRLALFFLAVSMIISTLILLPNIRLPGNYPLVISLNISLEGWNAVKNDRKLLVQLALYTVLNILLNGLSFWIAYIAVGVQISFPSALLISLIGVFSILLNVTPGNLGIQEVVISISSNLLGAGSGEGLLVALIVRTSTLLLVFVLGPIFSYILTKKLAVLKSQSHASP